MEVVLHSVHILASIGLLVYIYIYYMFYAPSYNSERVMSLHRHVLHVHVRTVGISVFSIRYNNVKVHT